MNFSQEAFRELLAAVLQSKKRVCTVSSFAEDPLKPTITLRHDIDADLTASLWMASEEASCGIAATYYFMVQSPVYNLLSRHALAVLHGIADLGHEIGLHLDVPGSAPVGSTRVPVSTQVEIMESIVRRPLTSFSVHQPKSLDEARAYSIPGLSNAYDLACRPDVTYLSDSSRAKYIPRALEREGVLSFDSITTESVQLLIHPMWWFYTQESGEEVWNAVLCDQFALTQHQLLETERVFGSKRRISFEDWK